MIVRTGRVHVCRKIPYNGQLLSVYRQAILIREGDRFSVYDPSAENELMRGCTAAFIQYLLDKEFLIYVEKAP
jgi:hypothetical protein